MIRRKGLQTQKPMPTLSFCATCDFWKDFEPYLLRCCLPMRVSCLLPGLNSSYFMLGQSAITHDSCRLKNRTKLKGEYFFFHEIYP